MTIRMKCPKCDAVLNIKGKYAGARGKCPKCGAKITVPEKSTVENKEPPPSEIVEDRRLE